MKIVLVSETRVRPDSTSIYFIKAFKDLGHELVHVQPSDIGQVKAGDADLYLKVDDGLSYARFRSDLHPSAYYVIDTHLDPEWRLDLEREAQFDFVFCAQKAGAALPWQAKEVSWLPLGADPDLHWVGKRPKVFDVGFIGNFHSAYAESRVRRVDALFKALPNFFYGPRMFKDMAEKYAESKLGFNSSLNQDINMRFFEVMMAGSCLLTDYIPEMDALGFKNGVHYVGYESDEDMIAKAKALVEDDQKREEIAMTGHMEVLAQHTYAKRCQKILEKVEELTTCRR